MATTFKEGYPLPWRRGLYKPDRKVLYNVGGTVAEYRLNTASSYKSVNFEDELSKGIWVLAASGGGGGGNIANGNQNYQVPWWDGSGSGQWQPSINFFVDYRLSDFSGGIIDHPMGYFSGWEYNSPAVSGINGIIYDNTFNALHSGLLSQNATGYASIESRADAMSALAIGVSGLLSGEEARLEIDAAVALNAQFNDALSGQAALTLRDSGEFALSGQILGGTSQSIVSSPTADILVITSQGLSGTVNAWYETAPPTIRNFVNAYPSLYQSEMIQSSSALRYTTIDLTTFNQGFLEITPTSATIECNINGSNANSVTVDTLGVTLFADSALSLFASRANFTADYFQIDTYNLPTMGYPDDSAAASAGLPIGAFYIDSNPGTEGMLRVRIT